MKINNNAWNKLRYTIYTPGYDLVAEVFRESRKKSIQSLQIKPGTKILIVGAGTGLDLEFLPHDCEVVATDITPSMITKINQRNSSFDTPVQTLVMDGQALGFEDNSFDIVILHLILAVIPDPIACIKEVERVIRTDGQIAVFDKFLPKNYKASYLRKAVNVFTNVLFSDITRDFESIHRQTNLKLVSDKDANFNGNFRLIKMVC